MKIKHFILFGIVLLILGIWLGKDFKSILGIEGRSSPTATIYEIPVPLPNFTLTDQDGEDFTQWSLNRKWTLMFFGYTFCPDVCPMALVDLNEVYNSLVEKGDLVEERFGVDTQVVFVSVDPGRDKVDGLKEYIGHFNDNFIGLTGSPEAIDSLARPMGVAYRRVPGKDADGDYYIDHSASFLLIDPLGRLRASFSPPHDAGLVAEEFRRIRDKYTEECCLTNVKFEYITLGGGDDEEEEEEEEEDDDK